MIRNFITDEGGATAIEYGMIAALIGVAIVLGVGAVGTQVDTLWGENTSEIVGALRDDETP